MKQNEIFLENNRQWYAAPNQECPCEGQNIELLFCSGEEFIPEDSSPETWFWGHDETCILSKGPLIIKGWRPVGSIDPLPELK